MRTKRINDPSRKWPGDVGVFEGSKLVLAVEVKQRPFNEREIIVFAQKLGQHEVMCGVIVELGGQGVYDLPRAAEQAHQHYGVTLQYANDAGHMLADVAFSSPGRMAQTLSGFPAMLMKRLEDIGVSAARRAE